MKAKKNLYEAPATKVMDIVNDAVMDVYDYILDDDGTPSDRPVMEGVLRVQEENDYILPTNDIAANIFGLLDAEEFQENVIRFVTKEYHKSLAV